MTREGPEATVISGPNFFIIGAAKAGTSSLCRYLAQHPEIYMAPIKEPHFFSRREVFEYACGPGDLSRLKDAVRDFADYCALFRDGADFAARGEASTTSLDSPAAARLIREYSPDAKIVVILRNPVDRAYASYLHLRRDGCEWHTDFAAALEAEPDRIRGKWGHLWHYRERQFSYEKLERYFKEFEKRQIRIYLYDDWKNENVTVLKDMFRFLGVSPDFQPDVSIRDNAGGAPKIEFVHRLMMNESTARAFLRRFAAPPMRRRIRRALRAANFRINLRRPQMSPAIREELTATFREDILRVQDLIECDLSHWLTPQ